MLRSYHPLVTHGLARIALVLVVAYVAYGALMFALQRSVLFPGRRVGGDAPTVTLPPGVQGVWLSTAVGRVEAWFLPGPAVTGPAFIFAHGNAEQIDDWPMSMSGAASLGASVLMVEYPGYGRSEGDPSEASIRETMLAAHDWLRARPEVDPTRIVGFGRSLGTGAVCTLVGQRALAALVLQSGFTSVRAFAHERFLPGFLVRDPFDNAAALARYDGPVLVIHGKHDDVIPYAHGRGLAAAARQAKLLTYACAHNDCPPDLGGMWRDVAEFLRMHRLLEP